MNEENLWEGDLLERKSEGEDLVNYLLNRHTANNGSSFVLNINAEWGFGKTYFLENLAKEFRNDNHPVVFFDAWKNDFTKNPLLAFMAEMNSSLEQYFDLSSTAKSMFKKAGTTLKALTVPVASKLLIGMAADKLEGLLDAEVEKSENTDDDEASDLEKEVSSVITKAAQKALAEHNTVKKSIETFKKEMTALIRYIDKKLPSKNLPMLVFIDELDRCRPNYAIELLEDIKHIFDIPGIVFVVATDSQQLAHSINAVYGNNFASERYLKRFFNQEYNLAKPDNYAYANYLFTNYGLLNGNKLFSPLEQSSYPNTDLNVVLFCEFSAFFKLSFRDQEQSAIMLQSIILVWNESGNIHFSYILFLIMLKQKDNEKFTKLNETPINKREQFIDEDFYKGVDVNSTVAFICRKDTEGGSNIIDYNILTLIKYYLKHLDITFANFNNKYTNNHIRNYIERSIIQEFKNNIIGYPDVSYKVTKMLNKYPDLVLRAGQFS